MSRKTALLGANLIAVIVVIALALLADGNGGVAGLDEALSIALTVMGFGGALIAAAVLAVTGPSRWMGIVLSVFYVMVLLPFPPIVLLIPFMIVLASVKARPGTPAPPGICVRCGYDLRGLPEPRCPECGTPFIQASVPPLPPKAGGQDPDRE